MINLTDNARKHLDNYLQQVRTYLKASPTVDADEVEQNIKEHVENELQDSPEPVSFDALDDILKKLGSPQQWLPEEERPWWRKIILRLRTDRQKYLWRISSFVIITAVILLVMVTVIDKKKSIDLAIAKNGFNIHPRPDGGLYFVVVSILNQGKFVSPEFPVNFYHGKPDQVEPKTHRAGPIEPGDVWREGTVPFALKEGVNEIVVVLDPYDKVEESNETNNSALLQVVVRQSKIVEKTLSCPFVKNQENH